MIISPAIVKNEKWRALDIHEQAVFLFLAVHADTTGRCNPSQAYIRQCLSIGRCKLFAALEEIESRGLIERDRAKSRGCKVTTEYRIVLPDSTNNSATRQYYSPVNSAARQTGIVLPGSTQTYKRTDKHIHDDFSIEAIYALYPSRDPNNQNRATGKCAKNKKQIEQLLKTGAPVRQSIESYLAECSRTKTYLKNFGTLLNNLPEVAPPAPVQKLGDCPEYHAASKNPSMAAMAKIREEMLAS